MSLIIAELVFHTREIEYAFKVKRIVSVDVYPEKRLTVIGEHLAVKSLILLVGAVLRSFKPERICVVYGFGSFFLGILAVFTGFVFGIFLFFRLGKLGKINLIRHKRAEFFKDFLNFIGVCVFFFLFIYVEDNFCSTLGFIVARAHFVVAVVVAFPPDGFFIVP